MVSVPVGTATLLAGAGIVGGLTIASSPFLAGYEAYNRIRGTPGINWSGLRVRMRESIVPAEPVAQLRPSGLVLIVHGHITEVAVGTTETHSRRYTIMQPRNPSAWDTGVRRATSMIADDSSSESSDDGDLPYDDFLTRGF